MAVSLALIIICGLFADYLFNKIKLPGLVGMLLVGILFGPFVFDIIQPELLTISGDLRMTALFIILLRAGLELKKDTLNRTGKTAAVMACFPAIVEGIAVTLLAPVFFEIDYLSAAILGAVLAAVSPAVVVHFMLGLIDRNRGAVKGIPSLILTSAAVNGVFVIVIFSILMDVAAGSGESLAWQALAIPESILMGLIVGAAAGFALFRLFQIYQPRATKMTLAVIAVAIMLKWLEEQIAGVVNMSALLSVMTMGFILLEKSEVNAHKISSKLAKFWVFAEILLFVLVGAQVNIWVAWEMGLLGAVLLFVALIARSAGTWLSLWGAGLEPKEKMFCVVSGLPKATVQAAIGALPLEMGIPGGEIILALAVLSIILTAPMGAMAISLTGDKWLSHDAPAKTLGASQ